MSGSVKSNSWTRLSITCRRRNNNWSVKMKNSSRPFPTWRKSTLKLFKKKILLKKNSKIGTSKSPNLINTFFKSSHKKYKTKTQPKPHSIKSTNSSKHNLIKSNKPSQKHQPSSFNSKKTNMKNKIKLLISKKLGKKLLWSFLKSPTKELNWRPKSKKFKKKRNNSNLLSI